MYCWKCGKNLGVIGAFCPNCGASFSNLPSSLTAKDNSEQLSPLTVENNSTQQPSLTVAGNPGQPPSLSATDSSDKPPSLTAADNPGQPPSLQYDITTMVNYAIQGDNSYWDGIFSHSYRYVYYQAMKFLKSEQDAQDVTQDVYMQVFRSIKSLNSADSFYGWLRSIVFSKCNDLVKKNKNILLNENDDEHSVINDLEENDDNFIPDMALDNDETKRMILDIVDALPYEQRQIIMYYYYDELPVSEIAELMDCPVGTVKSRLNYARKQIKQGVLEHEKKGVKLYGAAGLPVLLLLFKEQAYALTIPQELTNWFNTVDKNILNIQQAQMNMPEQFDPNLGNQQNPTSMTEQVNLNPVKQNSVNANRIGRTVSNKLFKNSLITKIAVGLSVSCILAGVIAFIVLPELNKPKQNNDGSSYSSAQQNDNSTQPEDDIVQPEDNIDTNNNYSLNYTQKLLISNIIEYMFLSRNDDIFDWLSTDKYQKLMNDISGVDGFWFYPFSNGSTAFFYGSSDIIIAEKEMRAFIESDPSGIFKITVFRGSKGYGQCHLLTYDNTSKNYMLAKTAFYAGVRHGPFIGHFINSNNGVQERYAQSGHHDRGVLLEQFHQKKNDVIIEINMPDWVNQLPDWSEFDTSINEWEIIPEAETEPPYGTIYTVFEIEGYDGSIKIKSDSQKNIMLKKIDIELLENMYTDIVNSNHNNVFKMQMSKEFDSIIKHIAYNDGFWYELDEFTSLHIMRMETRNDNMLLMYVSENENKDDGAGKLYMSWRNGKEKIYTLADIYYEGGVANGPITIYEYLYHAETPELSIIKGNLIDGMPGSDSYRESNGVIEEASFPNWIYQLPNWME
jgi:RNA polymerase sigma factor (sigma-70 family)